MQSLEIVLLQLTNCPFTINKHSSIFSLCRDDGKTNYLFISHTGYGGVAYAMAISCLIFQAKNELLRRTASSSKRPSAPEVVQTVSKHYGDTDEIYKEGDYRDVLSLTRVLANGPASKAQVDKVIDRYMCTLF